MSGKRPDTRYPAIMGINENGEYVPIKVGADGNLEVLSDIENVATETTLVDIQTKLNSLEEKINLNIDEEGTSKVKQAGSIVAEQLTQADASPYEGMTTVDNVDTYFTVETDEDLNEIIIEDNADENESVTFATGTITLDLNNTATYNDTDIATLIESDTDVTSAIVEGQSEQKASSEWLDTISMGATLLTFSEEIVAIEIYHENSTLQTFVVNGISLDIAEGGWRNPIGGTPSAEVTIPADLDCTVTRLE